jgi:magnesium transporter
VPSSAHGRGDRPDRTAQPAARSAAPAPPSLATPGRDGGEEPVLEPRPEIVETAALRWVNIGEPRLADRLWLAENFGFHELDLEDVREQLMGKGSGYLLYQILDRCVDASFPMLAQLGRKLRRLEDDIFEGGRSSEIVRDISNAKQEIINFRAIIRPQRAVFRSLERAKQRYLTDDLDIYFDDLTDASERIWDVLENFMEIVQGLESTNESVISHRLNDVLRVLTAFSVVVLPLTLLASIFGMNVHFPGESSDVAFWVILLLMAALLIGMVVFFRRRGWL